MANVFKITIQTTDARFVNVAATTAEEAQSKVVINEGETVVNVKDEGELLV